MPGLGGKIESQPAVRPSQCSKGWRVPYLDILTAVVGAVALAWIADLMTGRRGLFATLLVSGVGAVCGWFLAVRVFAVAVTGDWNWLMWSMLASVICLGAFFVFRSKR